MTTKNIFFISIIILPALILGACGKKPATFSDDTTPLEAIPTLVDKDADAPITFSQNYNLNQEFTVIYKTTGTATTGTAIFKARSIKEIPTAGQKTPEEGKKLVLVLISVRGNAKNQGEPSTFNQIGNTPSPQFVLIDQTNKKSLVEETYYSDGYTEANKLFELSKITLDHDKWVDTALVFQVDQSLTPQLALRFTNSSGNVEFYSVK